MIEFETGQFIFDGFNLDSNTTRDDFAKYFGKTVNIHNVTLDEEYAGIYKGQLMRFLHPKTLSDNIVIDAVEFSIEGTYIYCSAQNSVQATMDINEAVKLLVRPNPCTRFTVEWHWILPKMHIAQGQIYDIIFFLPTEHLEMLQPSYETLPREAQRFICDEVLSPGAGFFLAIESDVDLE